MLRENALTATAARLAGIPFRLLARRPLQPPHKLLILRPCCLSQVMLATPLLAALSEAYPRAQIDWAVSEWSRPGVASNPRISELIDTGRVGLPDATWADVRALVARLRQERYDTCIIPSRSSLLSWVAWRANIPQRVGLNQAGRGFAHTVAVKVPAGVQHESLVYLSLAQAFGIAAIEASAVGLPLITTAVGGLKDIVEEGKTGFFIQPDDHATLARRLHLLAKNPGLRRELGHAARQRAETQFNSYTNAGRIAHILQEVVAQKVC